MKLIVEDQVCGVRVGGVVHGYSACGVDDVGHIPRGCGSKFGDNYTDYTGL